MSSVRLSVTFVRLLGRLKFSAVLYATWYHRHPRTDKILRRSSQGNSSVGGVKRKSGSRIFWTFRRLNLRNGARYDVCYYESLIESGIWAFDWYQTRWPWMTLNGVIAPSLRYFTEFGSSRGALRKRGWRFLLQKCRPKNVVFRDISFLAILQGITPSESVKVRHSPLASENLTKNQP